MNEWVLVVWLLVSGGQIADPIEIGTYRMPEQCEAARDTVTVKEPHEGSSRPVSFIAICVERNK